LPVREGVCLKRGGVYVSAEAAPMKIVVKVAIETAKIKIREAFCSIERFEQWASSKQPELETLT